MLENPYITENDEDSFRTASLSDQQQNGASQNIQPVSPAQPAPEDIQVADSGREQQLEEIRNSDEYKQRVREARERIQDEELERETKSSHEQYSEPEAATSIDLGYTRHGKKSINIPPQKPRSQAQIQAHSMNRFIQKYGMNHEITTPDMTGRIREKKGIPSFDSIEEARINLKGDTTYFLNPPTEHMDGQFMATPWRPPTIAEASSDMAERVSKIAVSSVKELGSQLDMLQEALSVGAINGVEAMMQVALLINENAPSFGTAGRTIVDAFWLGQPLKGMETWKHERNTPEKVQYYAERSAEIKKAFSPFTAMMEKNLGGTEQADWRKSQLGRSTELFAEIMAGGSLLFKPVIGGIKFATSPVRTLQAIFSSVNSFRSVSASSSFAKASMQTVKNTIPKSKWIAHEADAAAAAVLVLEGTRQLLGPKNPVADLVALPLMLFAGVVQPGHRLVRGTEKAFLNHKVSFLSWFYGGFKGWKNPDTGRIGLPSPTDTVNPDKVRQIRINFLRSKGRLTDDEIDNLVYEPDENGLIVRNEEGTVSNTMRSDVDDVLLQHVGFEKISKGEEKKLRRITAALEELRINNKPEYDSLIKRMNHNYDIYTQLQTMANKSLPAGSREKVDIYLNQLTELAQFDALYAQFAATTNEGSRFFRMHRIRLNSTMHTMWKNQVRLRKVNVDTLKEIKDEFIKGGSKNAAAKQFIDYATEASQGIEAGIIRQTRVLQDFLDRGKRAAKSRTVKVTNDIQERLLPNSDKVNHGDYANAQRNLIDAINETDVKISNDKYAALGDVWDELDVDVTELRNTFASQLGILKSDGGVDSELIDVISDIANANMKSGQANRLAAHMTQEELVKLDKETLINIRNTIDVEEGKLPIDRDTGEPIFDVRHQRLSEKELIAKILRSKELAYSMVPATLKMKSLITLMRTLSKNTIKNAHTPLGHAYSVLWKKTMEYLDPTVTKTEIRIVDGKEVKVDVSAFKNNVTGLSGKDYERAALAFQSVQNFFKNEMVPRYRIGLGSLFQSGKANFADEALFQQFFTNPGDNVNRAKLARLYLTKIGDGENKWTLRADGTSPTYQLRDDETAKEFIKHLKYGLWRQLTDKSLTPVQVKTIISEFGSKTNSQFDIDKIDILEMMDPNLNTLLKNLDDSISTGWHLEYDDIMQNFDNLLSDVKDVKNLRLQNLKKSAADVIKESSNPYDFFFNPNIILKRDELTPSQMVYFERLIAEQGAVNLSKEGQEALTALKSRTLEDHNVGITPFEYFELATDGFKGPKGRLIKEGLQEVYARHISDSSIYLTGHKYPWVTKVRGRTGKTETQDFPEEHINHTAFTNVLEETAGIRAKLFDPDTNLAWEDALRRETTLLDTSSPKENISGMASPHRISSWMARGFSIARGVLSLRYFVGETAINHYRLGYTKMMKGLLTDPNAPFNLMQLLGTRKGHTKMNYAQGTKTMATYLGISAVELQQQIPPEEWEYLIENGHLRSVFFSRAIDAAERKDNLKAISKGIKKQTKREERTQPLSGSLSSTGKFTIERLKSPELAMLEDIEQTLKIRQKQLNP